MTLDSDILDMILSKLRNPSTRRELGGNSAVARVAIAGVTYAVKEYSQRSDAFLRQQREWRALNFLSDASPGLAPTPLWCSEDQPLLIYSWVTGSKPKWHSETVSAMVQILDVLRRTHDQLPEDHNLPLAVDSVNDVGDLSQQVSNRLIALKNSNIPDLRRICEYIGVQLEVLYSAQNQTGRRHEPQLTLSPSDFGPHNMIHDAAESRYRMIDLEFFGIDDVHKLLGDTILHPQIPWKSSLLERFLQESSEIFGFSSERLNGFLPFLSLKWATIVAGRIARSGDSSPNIQWSSDLVDLALFYSDLSQLDEAEEIFSRIVDRVPEKTPDP